MSFLFNDTRSGARARPRSRSKTGLWLSVIVHAMFIAFLTGVVPTRASEKTSTPRPPSIAVFRWPSIEPVTMRSVRVEPPRALVPPVAPRPVRETVIADVPKPVAVAPIAARAIEPVRPALAPAAEPIVERPAETRTPERPPEIGLFERTSGARTSQSAAAVATGGFGSVAPSARQADGADDVRTAGFDRRASARVQSSAAVPMPADRPVEIVFKPTPEYTDEARSARIEGTVTLDLEFSATGDIRVLRVVRGLGHGLDEAAARAALRIRFKPAQSDGRTVDSRATVHITFRLS
jgi:TonB family protein